MENSIIKEYDDNGNMVHSKDSDGYECWKEYNHNDIMIHCKDSNEFERWYGYDEINNCRTTYTEKPNL